MKDRQQQQQAVVVLNPVPRNSLAKTLGKSIPVQVLPQTFQVESNEQAQGKATITIWIMLTYWDKKITDNPPNNNK